jgi:hypothetical protein
MTSSPQFSPQDLAILAEIKYQREKVARLEAKQDSLYDPLDPVNERFVGGQIQADLDPAYEFHGRQAPQQRDGESASMYRRRLLAGLTPYSKDPDVAKFNFTDSKDLNWVPDFALPGYADQIKADALSPASHKVDVPPGEIKEIVKRDEGGRKVHEFVSGDGRTTFIHQIVAARSPRQILTRLGIPRDASTNARLDHTNPSGASYPVTERRRLLGGLPR